MRISPESIEAYSEPGPSATDLYPPAARINGDPANYPFPAEVTSFRSGGGRGRYIVLVLK